jgi:hypothetical protein
MTVRPRPTPRPRPVRTVEQVAPTEGRPHVELVRSTARRRSATAFVRDGRVVVQVPAGMDPVEEARLVEQLVDRVSGRLRATEVGGDDHLAVRARGLAERFLDGVMPASVTWSARMRRRWGSCTPADGTIRVSQVLAAFPAYVLDYVLVHELAHLQEPGHGPAFRALVDRYPDAARARGFLEGVQFADARFDGWPGPDVDGPVAEDADHNGRSG